jgi:hypothetical protein
MLALTCAASSWGLGFSPYISLVAAILLATRDAWQALIKSATASTSATANERLSIVDSCCVVWVAGSLTFAFCVVCFFLSTTNQRNLS